MIRNTNFNPVLEKFLRADVVALAEDKDMTKEKFLLVVGNYMSMLNSDDYREDFVSRCIEVYWKNCPSCESDSDVVGNFYFDIETQDAIEQEDIDNSFYWDCVNEDGDYYNNYCEYLKEHNVEDSDDSFSAFYAEEHWLFENYESRYDYLGFFNGEYSSFCRWVEVCQVDASELEDEEPIEKLW